MEDEYYQSMRAAGFDNWTYTVEPVGDEGCKDGIAVIHKNRTDK
jgi:hypothetical protein